MTPRRASPAPRPGVGDAALEPAPPWHALPVGEVERLLETGPRGLSLTELPSRSERFGPNQIETAPPPGWPATFLRQFRSPLIYLLLLAAAITVAVGERVDAGVIGVVLLLNALIGAYQEHRAEVSVRALMRLVSPTARVIREGREREVGSRELFPGDLVILDSGARVPADLRLLSTIALHVDESLLTGESLPVVKQARPLARAAALADRNNMAHTGSIVTSGRGRGYVVATGARTQLGAIAREIQAEERGKTPLQQRMRRLAGLVTGVVAAAAVAGFALGVSLGHSATEMFLLAVALAVAAVPEGLPVVVTITLAVGVRRMARRQAILRSLPAVETLGSATVIGSDKTGTLTENRMTVEQVWADGRIHRVSDGFPQALTLSDPDALGALHLALLCGVMTNEAEAFLSERGLEARGDPTEVALLVAAARAGIEHEEARAALRPFAEVPFEPERQYSASVREREGRYFTFVKGAPERVLGMCTSMRSGSTLAPLVPQAVEGVVRAMAEGGLRVLATAYAGNVSSPHGPDDVREPERLALLGLFGMKDPPRPGVREAVQRCQAAGIRVIMITGDHASTGRAIGEQLGIVEPGGQVLTGSDLAALDDAALGARLAEVRVFARVAPEEKLRVVRLLKAQGETVAVTGDGVNDAPALKAADVGIAMGRSGTDVAREASDMVLADDNFISIFAAIEEGRITFDNLRKATFFLLSTGAAAVITLLAALLLGWPSPFVPAQLLWLNLVTNGLQDVALAVEPGERGVLDRPPRPRGEGILSRLLWERTALAGLVMAVGTLVLFRWELAREGSLEAARTVALTAMVIFQLFHVGNSRSEHLSFLAKSPLSNRLLFFASAAAVVVHVGALHLAPTQLVLRVVPLPDLGAWARIVAMAATILVAVEAHKLVRGGLRGMGLGRARA